MAFTSVKGPREAPCQHRGLDVLSGATSAIPQAWSRHMILSRTVFSSALMAACIVTAVPTQAQETSDSWLPTLITETPEEGFDLAVSMARKAVKSTQPDVDALHKLRPAYSHDPESLISVSGVVADYFNTIAQANDFWRD
ncbi:hexameric tyrosine-coordinated heme protein [Caenispirillum salinarum]|uniref:hexameric tyrosine-coordinated heme protein n=1 Tax=Caenispirillum salinarum TaxID=859058 RepID=UPI00385055EC